MKQVEASSYSHEIFRTSPEEIFFCRSQVFKSPHSDIDVYGDFWSFLFADLQAPGLKIESQGQSTEAWGRIGILIPPHAVVHWQMRIPHLQWFACCSRRPYPSHFPSELKVYALENLPTEVHPSWLLQLVEDHSALPMIAGPQPGLYAKKMKALLDHDFQNNRPLNDYACDLGISKEWLIRYFKKAYGLTPIEYRNKKRLMQAFFELHSSQEKILSLSYEVGFNDLKQFNTLFKKVMQVTPSQLKP